jgi:hypothetical protein
MVIDWAGRVQRLEAEVSGLRLAMRHRGLIEQAKGRLAERLGIDPEQAFDLLTRMSQTSNVRVADLAAEVMGYLTDGLPSQPSAQLERADRRPPDEEDAAAWARASVDVLDTPALVLSPLWSDLGLDDFQIDYANAAAVTAWSRPGASPEGRRLLDTVPQMAYDGALEFLMHAFDPTRTPMPDRVRAGEVRAIRVGHRLLAVWPRAGRVDHLGGALVEEMGRLGWGRWSTTSAPLEFSPGLFRLLGRDPSAGPISLNQVIALLEPADRPRARALVDAALAQPAGPAATGPAGSSLDIRLAGGPYLRMSAVAQRSVLGRATAVVVLFEDVTEARRLSATADRLAAQQMHAAVERAQTEQLRSALFPPALTRTSAGSLQVVARHAGPSGIGRFRGDFYEICGPRPGLTVVIGDMFCSGIQAASLMIRLRHTARALALAGLGPGEIIWQLNRELCADDEPPLASLIVARLDDGTGALRWAQAGHYCPVLVRHDRARAMRRPPGYALGLLAETSFGEARVQLVADDLIVFYTDGVFQRWDPTTDRPRRLAAACVGARQVDGADGVLERLLQPTQDEACVVALEWRPRDA